MSNYTKSTNFAIKDGLVTTDPAKVIKGTEIDNEYNAISNAIASKADVNSPALTGIPTAPTAASGTNTTQLATTAFVTAALQLVYPVGSIYINAAVSTNPSTLLGFGTWAEFGAGRVLVGLNADDTLFDTLEETGGSKDSVIVDHKHQYSTVGSSGTTIQAGSGYDLQLFDSGLAIGGESGTNKNLQPYITVKMWKRTA